MFNWILSKIPAVRELIKENEKFRGQLQKLAANETTLYDVAVENGGLNITICGDTIRLMAAQMKKLLEEYKAQNYIQFGLREKGELEDSILVTVQRKEGKTPHELRMEAESKVKGLEEEIKILNTQLIRASNLIGAPSLKFQETGVSTPHPYSESCSCPECYFEKQSRIYHSKNDCSN